MRYLLVILFLLVASTANALTYYVDNTGGSDANDGLSVGNAWEHYQKACTLLVFGDTCFIRAGEYAEQSFDSVNFSGLIVYRGLYPKNNGTAGNEIVFKGFPGDALPVISGRNQTAPIWSTANLTGKSYIVFDSIHFNYGWRGIYLESGNDITIKNCIIDSTLGPCEDNNGGVITYVNELGSVKRLVVDNCEIFDNGELGEGACAPSDDYNAAVNTSGLHIYNADSSVFSNNTIHDQNDGIHIKGPKAGTGHDTTINIEIVGNTVHTTNNTGIWAIHQGIVLDLSINHNIVYNAGVPLLLDSGDDNVGDSGKGILVYNNTLHGGGGVAAFYSSMVACSVFNNIAFEYNNTFFDEGMIGFNNSGGNPDDFFSNYNLGWRTADDNHWAMWTSATSYTLTAWRTLWNDSTNSTNGDNSTFENPLFTNAGARDYSLQVGSPARTGGIGGAYPSYRGADTTGLGLGADTSRVRLSGNITIQGAVVIE